MVAAVGLTSAGLYRVKRFQYRTIRHSHVTESHLQAKDNTGKYHPDQGDNRNGLGKTTEVPRTGNEDLVTAEYATGDRNTVRDVWRRGEVEGQRSGAVDSTSQLTGSNNRQREDGIDGSFVGECQRAKRDGTSNHKPNRWTLRRKDYSVSYHKAENISPSSLRTGVCVFPLTW